MRLVCQFDSRLEAREENLVYFSPAMSIRNHGKVLSSLSCTKDMKVDFVNGSNLAEDLWRCPLENLRFKNTIENCMLNYLIYCILNEIFVAITKTP